MAIQTVQRNELAQRIAQLVGAEGMPVRPSDEADPHVATDDWGKVLVADYDAVQAALDDGAIIRDPDNGFLKTSAAP